MWSGHCYEAAVAFASLNRDAVVVHARGRGVDPGTLPPGLVKLAEIVGPTRWEWFDHAFCELGDLVHDLTVEGGLRGIPREAFYYVLGAKPEEAARYPWPAVVRMVERFKHCGPWRPRAK
jgi:hypothetical protein